MLYISKSFYNFHEYFRFSPQLFNIMKKLCKRAMTWEITFLKFLTRGQKRAEYPLIPKIMIDDWVNKGHTNLNIFSVVGEQIRSLSSKLSKLNFETNYTQKLHFYAVSGHKQPPDDQTLQFLHKVSKQFWKLWLTRFFRAQV